MITHEIHLGHAAPEANAPDDDTTERTVWTALWLGLKTFRLGLELDCIIGGSRFARDDNIMAGKDSVCSFVFGAA